MYDMNFYTCTKRIVSYEFVVNLMALKLRMHVHVVQELHKTPNAMAGGVFVTN